MRPSRSLTLGAALAAALVLQAAPAHAEARTAHKVGLPFLWPEKGLSDIEAAAPDQVWIAGFQGRLYGPAPGGMGLRVISENPVARRWTGTGWKEYPINGWTGHGHLTRAAARGGDAWISGIQNSTDDRTRRPYLARLTGGAFQPVAPPPGLLTGEVPVTAQPGGIFVHGSTADGTGRPHLWRYADGAWTAYPVPGVAGAVAALDAPAADDVWLAGADPNGGKNPLVTHWNGTAWQGSSIPEGGLSGTFVTRLVAPAADHAWAAGIGISYTSTPSRPFLARWDGTAWTRVPFPDGVTNITRFTRAPDGTVWALGRPPVADRVTVLRLDGTAWRPVDTVDLPAGTRFTDAELVPETRRVWVRGTPGDAELNSPLVLTDQ